MLLLAYDCFQELCTSQVHTKVDISLNIDYFLNHCAVPNSFNFLGDSSQQMNHAQKKMRPQK